MAKRILAMLLVMAMVFSVLPTGVFADGEGQGQQAQPASQVLTHDHDDSVHKCEHCLKLDKTDAEAIVAWEPWGDTEDERSKLPNGSDGKTHYVLMHNIEPTTQMAVSSRDITICLNGYNVTMKNTSHMFRLSGTGKVSIVDCTAKTVEENGQQVYKAGTMRPYSTGYVVMMTNDGSTVNSAVFNLHAGIITGAITNSGSVANMKGKATFNMYGGEISGNTGGSGSIYMADYAAFNMYGGVVTGNRATTGGAFYLTGTNTKLLIENGKVTNNVADTAGAIYVRNGSVTLDGATITGNRTATSYGAVFLTNDGGTARITMKGDTQITGNVFGSETSTVERNLYLRDHWITPVAKDLSAKATIGVYVETNRINATNGKQYVTGALNGVDLSACFSSDRPEYMPAYTTADSGRIIMVVKPEHPHSICCDDNCADGHGNVSFTRWGDDAAEKTKLPTSGYYYLFDDIDLQTPTNVYGDLVICLNGHNIVASKNINVFRTAGSGKVTITDCQAKTVEENGQQVYKAGKITPYNGAYTVMMATDKTNGVEVASTAVFNLYAGIITGATKNTGSVVNMKSNTVFNMYGGEISDNAGGGNGPIYMSGNAKFNAYGGTIKDNSAGSGGAFYLASAGTVLTVDGATIMDNDATGYGGAIMAANSSKVNIVSGKITGNESPAGGAIYMSKKTTLTMTGGEISGNTSTGSGGAVYHLESTGTYSGGTISDNKATGSGAAIFNNTATVILSGTTVSGNTAGNNGGAVYGNASSKTSVQSGEISGNTAKNQGGAIYAVGAEVNLNGGKITKNKAGSGGGVYATDAGAVVNVNGSEVSENEASSGGGMLIASGTVLNLASGKISGNTASSGAGLYMSKKSTINMTGGEISDNTSTGSGAGVYHLESTGNYTGGSICGNTSDYNGGAMFLNGAEVNLDSVSITENEAVGAGGIYVNDKTVLTVTGEPVVQNNIANGKKSNIYLPGKVTFKVDNVGENAKVGLSAAAAFRFVTEENDNDYSKGFTSDRASLQVEYKEKKLYLGASGNHAHCLCDSNAAGCDHNEVLFAAWDDPNSLPASGNWYLNTDVTLTKAVDMRDVTLNLCLNGHTIKMNAENSMIFDVKGAANLNITDCAEKTGMITGATKSAIFGNNNSTAKINLYNGIITGNSGSNAGAVFLQSNQVFNMYGGKITGNLKESASAGAGAICAYYGTVNVNIYGGEISGNKSVAVITKDADGNEIKEGGNAGAIYAEGNSVKVNLQGGTISNNAADVAGGAVYAIKGATINLKGTKLSGNTAGSKAGAVYATGAAKVNLSGGELSGNSAPNGGAMLVESGAIVEVTGGKVTGNKASDGAGIYMTTRTTFNMTGGEISGNIAEGNGGGLALLRCEATISGGTISENSAKYGGGMLVRGANLNLKGGQIIKNTATNNGGGIKTGNQNAGEDVYTAKIIMSDGIISENTANYGGGVIVEGAGCEMVMQGGEISKNTANYGGGMFVSTKTVFNMEGGKIANNTAKKTGGGIQMLNSTATFTGGELSGNQCPSTGGAIYVNDKDSVATFDGVKVTKNKGGYGGGACAANRGKIIFKSGTFSNNTAVNNGGGMYISTNSTLDMYGGTITGNNVEKDTGGGLYGLRSTMNLYGGTVSYNSSSIGGGGIMVAAAKLNLKGADVLYNTAISKSGTGGTGGGVRTNCQTVTKNGVTTEYFAEIVMTAGTIKGNECGYGGGGVLVNGVGASMKMSGGTICDNISRDLGGGLYVSNQTTFTMTGGEVCRNEAVKDGGGFWLAKNTTHSMANAKIYENTARKAGGVYFHNNAACTFTDVEFTKNVSTNGGAIFGQQDMNPIMIRCTFTENESTEYSGGAIFSRYKATIQDCKFVGNKSAGSGGAVYVGQSSLSVNGWGNSDRDDAGIYITNTTFENNTAKATGGALHIIMSGFTEIKDTTFTGNSAGEAGTAIWTEEDLTMEDVTITGNKGAEGVHAVYLAASEYDGESYFKGLMKMGGNMIIRDNEGGDLYLAEKTTVTVLGSGFGEKTHIGVTLDSGVLTQRVYGSYNYEGGNCVYTITYGDRSLTDPEIDASLLAAAEGDSASVQDILLYAGVGVFVLAVAAVVVVLLARKKKNAAKEAVEE